MYKRQVTYDPEGLEITEPPAACSGDPGTLSCSVPSVGTVALLTFEVALVDRPSTSADETLTFSVSADGYTETDILNNTKLSVLSRMLGSPGGGIAASDIG